MNKKLIYLISLFLLMGPITGVSNALDPFAQDAGSDGIVAMEAENYDVNLPGGQRRVLDTNDWVYIYYEHTWEEVINVTQPNEPNFIITNPAMQGLPDEWYTEGYSEHTFAHSNAPRMDYEINFVKSGTHYVWFRCWADNGGNNSFWVGLDNEVDSMLRITPNHDGYHGNDDPCPPDEYRDWNYDEIYDWDNEVDEYGGQGVDGDPLSYEITPGVHTINIWLREEGVLIDTIVITTNPNYDPNEVNDGNGPPESPRVSLEKASGASPSNGEQNVFPEVLLSWTPGIYAEKHDIYFDTDFADVNDANRSEHPGLMYFDVNLSDNNYPAGGTLNLDFGQTYYWRVDEVKDNEPASPWKGDVWQFTVEPNCWLLDNEHYINATASSFIAGQDPNKTIDGSGMIGVAHSNEPNDMWLTTSPYVANTEWIEIELDRLYQLNAIKIWNYNETGETDRGFQDVKIECSRTLGGPYLPMGTHFLNQAPGSSNYTGEPQINLPNRIAKFVKLTCVTNWGDPFHCGLSEVRLFYTPLRARIPVPATGATNFNPNTVVLNWRPGREAAEHHVYFSNDEDAVEDNSAYVATVYPPNTSYNAGELKSLELDTTYYWKITEVNDAEDPNVWEGNIWEFDTVEYFVVDDMDDYGDDDTLPWVPGGWIQYVWRDGWYISGQMPANGTGSQVHHWNNQETGFSESTIFRSGLSMPYYYENDGDADTKPVDTYTNDELEYYSEARANISDLRCETDWSPARVLSLWFYGDPCNSTEPNDWMYVVLEDSDSNDVVYYDPAHNYDPNDLKELSWHEWNINLSEFTGVDMNDIQKIYIGFGDKENPKTGGKGIVYFDDIRLYSSKCSPLQRKPDFDFDDDCEVDYDDLDVLTKHWLLTDSTYTGELILHWKFDSADGGIAVDDSGYGRHGDINDATYDAVGEVNGCLVFSNGQHVTDNDANAYMNGLYGLSVCLWIKSNEIDTDHGAIVFDSIENMEDFIYAGDQRNIRYDDESSYSTRENIIACGVTTTAGEQDIQSRDNMQTTDWQHIAMTWTAGQNVKLYINGDLDYYAFTNDPPAIGTTIEYDGVTVGRGKEDNDPNEGWNGKIDDVQIYNYELTPAEIQIVMGGGTIDDPKPGLYFPIVSPAEIYTTGSPKVINFKDFATLVGSEDWLADPMLWP